ncbi:hypothetical protein [Candidatus Accumulibacter sp. ACC003]|uniref:hypothetical protein n=1 Tax=Candidatus Accumulibacter sp. ACC003 TaxID=2823334 RepID=UPI0025C67399|nr:hypothetical protein [Candidatus Accumulibacter sp. ACC003]
MLRRRCESGEGQRQGSRDAALVAGAGAAGVQHQRAGSYAGLQPTVFGDRQAGFFQIAGGLFERQRQTVEVGAERAQVIAAPTSKPRFKKVGALFFAPGRQPQRLGQATPGRIARAQQHVVAIAVGKQGSQQLGSSALS